MKTLALFGVLLLASASCAADVVSATRPAEVEVCRVYMDSLLTKRSNAVLSCGRLGETTLGEVYAKGWRIRSVLDTSKLCNQLSPCAVLFLER